MRVMPHTDRRGRELKQFLQAEILNRDVTLEELYEACGLTKAQFYGAGVGSGRRYADDFPNADELRHLADSYDLGDDGYVNLLVEFQVIEPRDDAPGFSRPPLAVAERKETRKRTKLSERQASKTKPTL